MDDPLPSWNAGAAKMAILDFIDRVGQEGGSDYVAPAERIAVFDNDGTLWCECPAYAQALFLLERLHEQAAQDAELAGQPVVQACSPVTWRPRASTAPRRWRRSWCRRTQV